MFLSVKELEALKVLADLCNAKGVDVTHVNKRGGSSNLRVRVTHPDGGKSGFMLLSDGELRRGIE